MSKYLKDAYQAMREYVPGEQPKIEGLIKLNTNENPYPPSPAVIAAINRTEVEKLPLYSDPTANDLVEAIAHFYHLAPENVMVGNGSDEVLALAILAFGADGLTFPDLTYGFYPVWANLFGLKTRIHNLRDDFTVDPADYARDDKMVLIANPNAPTGIALDVPQIEEILRANPNHVVLVDEAYVDFGTQSAVSLIQQHKNLLVVQTFSKARSLAGARIGFALGDQDLIADLNKIKFSFHPYNLNRLSILAGTAAMNDAKYYEKCREKVICERETARTKLVELGFTVLPSKANFLFAKPPKISGKDYFLALRARAVLVRHFDIERARDFVRVTIGTRAQMEKLLSATREILETEGI